jgi:hypothetical protein
MFGWTFTNPKFGCKIKEGVYLVPKKIQLKSTLIDYNVLA